MPNVEPLRDVYINGRFFTQKIGGVQRFARELVRALDVRLSSNNDDVRLRKWILVVPGPLALPLELRYITVKVARGLSGHLWDQLILPWVARDGILISLTNSGPVLHPRSAVIIHDAAVFRTPKNFSTTYALVHRLLGLALARTCRMGTVSEFSRRELATALRIDGSRMFVVPNSCEHLRDIIPSDTVLERLGVKAGKFFLLVGQPSPNKNFPMAMAAFSKLRIEAVQLVIVGAADSAVFRQGIDAAPAGVVVAGHVSDEELVALFRNAIALVFPSIYEGFGIPPLEAMVHGCPVLASRIPPVEEVCGDAARYFDPNSSDSIAQAMKSSTLDLGIRDEMVQRGFAQAARYSWDQSARYLLSTVARMRNGSDRIGRPVELPRE
jgi:glycosyltransferase involved in cell wall biosynthesis